MGCGMMKMYLNWETSVPHVFFKWWTADTPFTFLLSLIIIFALCFAYEGLITYRSRYDAFLNESTVFPADFKVKPALSFKQQLIRSSLFAFSNGFSLFIMMIFMIYNGYMCISCVAGAFAGHLTFALYLPEEELSKRPRSCCD